MKWTIWTALLLVCACLPAQDAWTQQNVQDYYAGLSDLRGEELKAALHARIAGHTVYPYFAGDENPTGVGEMMQVLDADPQRPGNVILFYSGRSQPFAWADHGDDFDYAAYGISHDDTWNREHLWAKSHGFAEMEDIAYSDIHHLHPADRSINGSKGAKDFDWGGAPDDEAPGSYTDYDSWEPRADVKGDLARAMFYMAVRYEGDDDDYDLELVDETGTSGPRLGRLSTLLAWNELDPPSEAERARNELVYTSYQHNRNPFIDHPEYARRIWGSQPANPRVTASLPWIDFGDVKLGETSQPVRLWVCHSGKDMSTTLLLPGASVTSLDGGYTNDAVSNRPLELAFAPQTTGVKEGELRLAVQGAEVRVPLYARAISPNTQTLLEARFEGSWEGWQPISMASNKDWELDSYDDRRFAKAGGYRADEASDDWLVSPPIDLRGYRDAAMRFETAKNHRDDIEGLEVLVSADYTGDPAAAHWTALRPVLSQGRYEWAASGWLSLDEWNGKEIRVAFRYQCTSPKKSTSWELDDIRLTAVPE